jgi:hypothetical protein
LRLIASGLLPWKMALLVGPFSFFLLREKGQIRNAPPWLALDSAGRLAKAPPGPVTTAVRQILDQKGHEVWSVHPGDTVYDAIKMTADKDVGALVVLDASEIVGIVTERDYADGQLMS